MRYSKKIKRVESKLSDGWKIVKRYRWVSEDGNVTRQWQKILILKHRNGFDVVIPYPNWLTPAGILDTIKHYEKCYNQKQECLKAEEKYGEQMMISDQSKSRRSK